MKKLASALGMEVTEPEGGKESDAGADVDMGGMFGSTTEGAEVENARRLIRSELESNWASGQVFGKKTTNRGGVTMGFKGIGFK